MAQAEDTELRDLVIEALEKNGSLAKIRALLRANIFLAFEDECQSIKQNVSLDNILNLPEGVLSLCIIHEFLEFCNLKNTLFVYMSESRQGKEYRYEGKNSIADKLNLPKLDKEPVLITIIKSISQQFQQKYSTQSENFKTKSDKRYSGNYRDDENCTYIVHEDSTGTSQSQSDNSSDEKNKLRFRLQLDNSDTDTSSDSARDKSSSEYIANEHILGAHSDQHKCTLKEKKLEELKNTPKNQETKTSIINSLHDQKVATNSSSESTSYVELKPFNPLDKLLLNTTGLPIIEESSKNSSLQIQPNTQSTSKHESSSPISSSVSTESHKNVVHSDNNANNSPKTSSHSHKLEGESAEYSYDFMPSSVSSHKSLQSQEYVKENSKNKSSHNSSTESQNQNSESSQSSISISDVADLISDNANFKKHSKSISGSEKNKSRSLEIHKLDRSFNIFHSKQTSDDSGDFSESPIPSLSNLSLDIHSD